MHDTWWTISGQAFKGFYALVETVKGLMCFTHIANGFCGASRKGGSEVSKELDATLRDQGMIDEFPHLFTVTLSMAYRCLCDRDMALLFFTIPASEDCPCSNRPTVWGWTRTSALL